MSRDAPGMCREVSGGARGASPAARGRPRDCESVTSCPYSLVQRLAWWRMPVEGSGRRAEQQRVEPAGACACRPSVHARSRRAPSELSR